MRKQEAIDHFSGESSALADALGISPAAVSQWGEFPPDKRQLQIERLTGGTLKAEPGCLERLTGLGENVGA